MPQRRPGNFTARVDRVIKRVLRDEPRKGPEETGDVRQVAFALVTLRRLVEKELKATKPFDLPGSGLVPAADLVDALMTGANNPVYRYLKEARGTKRQNKAPATGITEMRQAVIVGALRSLQSDIEPRLTQSEAAKLVVASIRSLDVAFTKAQIIGWDNRFSKKQDRFPDAFRGTILQQIGDRKPTVNTILHIAALYARSLWTVPIERS